MSVLSSLETIDLSRYMLNYNLILLTIGIAFETSL
jgi:hypothetical protein